MESIGSGQTKTLAAHYVRLNPVLYADIPEWIRLGYGWVIFKVGQAGYWAQGPFNNADLAVFDPTLTSLTITMPCSPYPPEINPVGSVIDGPLIALELFNIVYSAGYYDVVYIQTVAYNWIVEEICPGVIEVIKDDKNPPGDVRGIDVLYWKEGYTIAEVIAEHNDDGTLKDAGKLQVVNRWREEMEFNEDPVVVDEHDDCRRPKLSHPAPGPPLGLLYVRAGGVYRQESYDYGETWLPDPEDGKAFIEGSGNMAAVEVWNERTGERCEFYLASSGIKVDVWGPETDPTTNRLKKQKTYVVVDKADNSSFGAIFIRDSGAIDCCFQSGGARRVYRSHDDARSFYREDTPTA